MALTAPRRVTPLYSGGLTSSGVIDRLTNQGVATPRTPTTPTAPTPTPAPTTPTAPTPPTAQLPPMDQAIAEYQAANAAGGDAFTGIVPWLNQRGYQVSYATHGVNGSERSGDAIVDSSGTAWDLLIDSDSATPRWYVGNAGAYDPTRRVQTQDGTSQLFSEWQTSVGATPRNPSPTPTPPGGGSTDPNRPPPVGADPPHGTNPRNKPPVGHAIPRGTAGSKASSDTYAAAYAAQARIRKGAVGGRGGTVYGGFRPGGPSTQVTTLLGR